MPPIQLRLETAKTILDRAGNIEPKAKEQQQDPVTRPMSLSSRDELQAFIAQKRAEAELQSRSEIDVEKVTEPSEQI